MTISTVKIGIDAHVAENRPDDNFGRDPYLKLAATGGNIRRAFVWPARPFPLGATVIDAKLQLYTRTAWDDGPYTLTVKTVTQAWKEAGAGGITWNNQPTVDTPSATVIVADNTPAGTLVEIDITTLMQTVAAGGDYHGFRIASDVTIEDRLHSAESATSAMRPRLVVQWTTEPGEPIDLIPSGAQVVGEAQPTLVWTFTDAEGDAQEEFQVQIDTVNTFPTPDHDSGFIASADTEYDLATTAFSLTPATTYFWRVRTKDEHGTTSEWSDPAEFSYRAPGVLTITSPTAGGTVEETTPTITHTFTGETQEVVRYILEGIDDDTGLFEELYDSGRITTTATSFAIPAGHIDKMTDNYRITVRVWDTRDRVATPGVKRYVEAQHLFTFIRSATPSPVTALSVTAETNGPGIVLDWTRATGPDYFAIRVDGKLIEDRLDPADAALGGGLYRTTIYTPRPQQSHTFEVEAVTLTGGDYKHSQGNATDTFTPEPKAIWLTVPSDALEVAIVGKVVIPRDIGQNLETFFPINRRDPVQRRDVVRGYEGTIVGQLTQVYGRTGAAYRADLEQIKGLAAGTTIYLIFFDNAFEVIIGAPQIANSGPDLYEVSIPFWQVGNFTIPRNR